LDALRSGVVVCGGGARIPGLQKLAEDIFGVPATVGSTQGINGLRTALDQPEFAAAIGLVKFGSFQQKARKTNGHVFGRVLRDTFGILWRKD
jgi:cell division protein FtsA